MSAIGRSIDNLSFLTETAREALRRRLRELAGIALIALALLLAATLATWSVQDPSFNHATNAPVRNALGIVGAVTGCGALLAFTIAVGYGWQGETEIAQESRGVVERDERASISIGFLVHGIISLKSRLARLFTRGRRLRGEARRERPEPGFD